MFESMALNGLSTGELRSLAQANGIPEPEVDTLVRQAHGSPLAVTVGLHAGQGGSVAELADRLLGDEVDSDRYRTLSVAAIARVTTPELLEAVQPGTDGHEAYKWLADRSFAEPLADGVALHALVAEAVRAVLRERDPTGEGALRRAIADFVYERALAGQFALSADLQHLVVDPDVRWGFSADIGSRYRIDEVRPGDIETIGSILHSVGLDEWWEITSVFFREPPRVRRDRPRRRRWRRRLLRRRRPGNARRRRRPTCCSARGCAMCARRCRPTTPCCGARRST